MSQTKSRGKGRKQVGIERSSWQQETRTAYVKRWEQTAKLSSCIKEADKSFKKLGRLGAQSWVRKSNEEQK